MLLFIYSAGLDRDLTLGGAVKECPGYVVGGMSWERLTLWSL